MKRESSSKNSDNKCLDYNPQKYIKKSKKLYYLSALSAMVSPVNNTRLPDAGHFTIDRTALVYVSL